MCYHCMEENAIETLIHGEGEHNRFDWFDIQESDDLLNYLNKHKTNIDCSFSYVSNAILCKTLEILIEFGFDSCQYQSLIQNDIIKEVITRNCVKKRSQIKSYLKKLIIHREKPSFDKKLFYSHLDEIINVFLNTSFFLKLYQIDTFFNKELSNIIIQNEILKECQDIIQFYIEWYFKYDEMYSIEEIEESKHHVYRGIAFIYDVFDICFRTIYFSFLIITKKDCDKNILLKLLKNRTFHDSDKWLKRITAKKFIHFYGLHELLEKLFYKTTEINDLTWIEPQHFAYLSYKFNFSFEDRKLICEAFRSTEIFEFCEWAYNIEDKPDGSDESYMDFVIKYIKRNNIKL